MAQVRRVGSRLRGFAAMTLIIVLVGGAFAAEKQENLEMIVVFKLGGKTLDERIQELEALKQTIEEKGKALEIQVVHILALSDALALQFPAIALKEVLAFLEAEKLPVIESNLKRIVIFKAGTDLQEMETKIEASGLDIEVVHTLRLINALAVEFPASRLNDVLNFLVGELGGQVVDDPLATLDSLPHTSQHRGSGKEKGGSGDDDDPPDDDPDDNEGKQEYPWNMQTIAVPEVHEDMVNVDGAGVTVAILDTGIYPHPALLQNIDMTRGFNALPNMGPCADPVWCSDGHGHGTHIAGIIAAANGSEIIGVAPRATIVAVKVLHDDATGFLSDLINGMGWVYDHDIRLLNLSLGFSAANLALELATQRLYEDKGAIMVASAGNRTDGGSEEGDGDEECTEPPANEEGDGDEEDEEDVGGQTATVCDPSQVAVRHPARYPWVIAVGATDIDNAITAYSRLGAELDLVAPGGAVLSGQIRSTAPGGGYDDKSGTSQAAPHVTGALALALQQNPDLAFEDVLDVLAQSARNLGYEATKQGAGLLNVEDMIKYLRD